MSAKAERRIPYLVAVIAGAIAAAVAFVYDIEPLPKSMAAGTMTFGVVVAGFAAIQRNMLLGMSGSSVLQFAVRTGYYKDVLVYLMHGVYAGVLVSVVSVIRFFLGDNNLLLSIWLVVLTAVISLVLALIVRNEFLTVRIIKRFLEEQDPRKG